jgi:iron complex outermembrane recepter protein
MTTHNIKRKLLSSSIAAIVGSLSIGVMAQEAEAPVEEIVITGIRASLTKAMDIKRNAAGVVDAISAEDMGKMPDSNLAEAIQRVPGVSIDRSNNEGNQVSVRGMGPEFNLVTLNGRQMPSAGPFSSRAFDFADLSAESVAGVEVYKTTKVNVDSGGIGSTINIKSARPLDIGKQLISGSVSGIVDTTSEGKTVTPEVSALYSNVFADGMFGFLIGGSSSIRESSEDRVAVDGWVLNPAQYAKKPVTTAEIRNNAWVDASANTNPDGNIWMPRNYNVGVNAHRRERTNGMLVFQITPIDTIKTTLNYNVTNYEDTDSRSQLGVWFNGGNQFSTTDAPVTTAKTNANGTVVNITEYTNGSSTDFFARKGIFVRESKSAGLNVMWDVTEDIELGFDYHNSSAESQPNGEEDANFVILSKPNGKTFTITQGNEIPILSDLDTTFAKEAATDATYLDPSGFNSNLIRKGTRNDINKIEQFKIDGLWKNSSESAFTKAKFGLSNSANTFSFKDFNNQNTNWAFSAGAANIPDDFIQAFTRGNGFMDQFNNGNQVTKLWGEFNYANMYNLLNTLKGGTGFEGGVVLEQDELVEEDTTAAYAEANFEFELSNKQVNTSVGVRYETTDVASTSLSTVPLNLFRQSGTELGAAFPKNAAGKDIRGYTTQYNDYSIVLPSFDADIELTETIKSRFSFGRSISRAPLVALRGGTNLFSKKIPGPYSAASGNPGLKPYLSDNFDLSTEWYYTNSSYVSAGYFFKKVNDFIGSGVRSGSVLATNGEPLYDPSNGGKTPVDPAIPNKPGTSADEVAQFNISSPVNGDPANIKGWEFAIQHMFGESGFGTQINYTDVSSDVAFDILAADHPRAITGLSNSANAIVFFEAENWQTRAAYNWRDEFLAGTGQDQGPNEPTFVEAFGQLDLSGSYNINDNFTFYIDALNVTNEVIRVHGRFKEQLLQAIQYGPRYNVGVRVKF